MSTPSGSGADVVRHVDHVIVGAGFAGLCAAIKLQEDGETDFVVLEKGPDVGGTWRDNTYPGATCDVPSQLYSYSFAPYDWSRSYSPQPEIQDYIKKVADASGTLDRFVFDTPMDDAAWDDAAQRWTVRTPNGTWVSKTLVVGAGGLSEPRMPEIEGIDTFQGEVFHSARWDHGVDLSGKRVAVIGTGASAIQIVPEVAKVASHVDVYQRTAPWVIPRNDRVYSRAERAALRRVPGLRKLYRTGLYWGHEAFVPAFTLQPKLAAPARMQALRNISKSISDPELRAKLTPDYEIGCKRILISNDYYPSLGRDNVEVVTEGVAEVRGNTVVGSDGTEAEVDTIIFGTGFHVTDTPAADLIHGVGGRSLRDVWGPSMHAHRGTTIAGFPNMFMLGGPHTGIGHTSLTVMLEAQVEYLIDALTQLDQRGHARIEVRPEAQEAFLKGLDRKMEGTVWTSGGCQSWYLDSTGRNTTLWPDYTFRFKQQMKHADLSEFTTAPARVPVA